MNTQTSESDGCCGQCFKFDIVNPEDVSNLTFYKGDGEIIIVVYEKDGHLYFSISYNCGQTFEPPEEVLDLEGTLRDVRVLTKGDQFVVTVKIIDNKSKKDVKKAVSGFIYSEKKDVKTSDQYTDSERNRFSFKACTLREPRGKLVNISLSFRDYVDTETGESGEESVDYSFYLDDDGKVCIDCDGHRCVVR